MTPRDESTEPDVHDAASAVYDGEASLEEQVFVEEHPEGPTLLAAYDALRNDLRQIVAFDENIFANMRARAVAETHPEIADRTMAVDESAASPGRPVTNLAPRRSLRSVGPKLVGVAAVAILGIGVVALANRGPDSPSGDSTSAATARTEMGSSSADATGESNATAPSDADGKSLGGLNRGGDADNGYFGSFDTVADLEAFYRQRGRSSASSAPNNDEAGGVSGASGREDATSSSPRTPSADSMRYQACGDRIGVATLAGQEVLLVDSVDQIRVLDVATCAVVAAFAS